MKFRLLIADDNEIQIESILTYIDKEDFDIGEIRTAEDGMECIEIARKFKPHIVITDVEMPNLNGLELAQRLREMDSRIKLIFISCHDKFEYAQKAMMYGARAYILKPFMHQDIQKVISQVVLELNEELSIDSMRTEFMEKQKKFESEFDIKETDDKKLDVLTIQEDILEFVEREDVKGVSEYFNQKYFLGALEKNFTYTKYVCYSIVIALHMVARTKGISIDALFGSDEILWDKLASFKNKEELINWLSNLIYMLVKHIIETNNNNYHKIANDIKNIIDTRIYDIESVEQIANELKISVSYAKRIFKKQTGITIFDYLFERRMKEAKLLLKDPYLCVYEIADKLGYKSKTYFATAFQKYTGMTPNEYRKHGD